MNILTQEARRRQGVVKLALRKGKSFAARMYGVSLSSVKRWCKRYDGHWKSLLERSHRPKSHPNQQTADEEKMIEIAFKAKYYRYGLDGVYDDLIKKHGYKRSFWGMYNAIRRMKLLELPKKRPPRKALRRFPEILTPGQKIQIDVKEVPYYCIRGDLRKWGKHLYQWTAIDECTRWRFVYGYEEHTPENSVDFLKRLIEVAPFKIETIQTDNGSEFTYKYISDKEICPFDKSLKAAEIAHKLIPPRTPWHNGKVERSHRNDQRYFYDWEKFRSLEGFNVKLAEHLEWSNNRAMRIFKGMSAQERLQSMLEAA
jgi:transposase InsO family protein